MINKPEERETNYTCKQLSYLDSRFFFFLLLINGSPQLLVIEKVSISSAYKCSFSGGKCIQTCGEKGNIGVNRKVKSRVARRVRVLNNSGTIDILKLNRIKEAI